MRRFTPVLVLSLLYSPGTFAGDDPDSEAKTNVAQSAFVEKLVGAWDVRYEFIDEAGKARVNSG